MLEMFHDGGSRYVGDFGISKPILAEQSGMHSRVGTHDYVALEMFWDDYNDMDDEDALPCTVAVDPWSLGRVLYRPLTRQLPLGTSSSLLRQCTSKSIVSMDALNQKDFSRDVIAILFEIMKPQPAERINVTSFMGLY